MLNVLLVKLEPLNYRGEDTKSLVSNEKYTVQLSEDQAADLSVVREYYVGSEEFNNKVDEIHNSLGIEYGGRVVAIDKYPIESYHGGAEKTDWSGNERYITQFSVNASLYDLVILLCPDFERIVLADLNFSYKGSAYINGHGLLMFSNKAVLSVKTFWGEFRGIALQKYNKLALDPNNPNEYYIMRFEKREIPDVVLNKML